MTVKTKLTEPPDQLLQIRVSRGFLRDLDEWRRKQPDLPTRSEAVRRIVNEVTARKR